MINPRKLTAIDLLLLGGKFIIAEFAFAVVFCPALGVWTLIRRHVPWQTVLGWYLVSLGLNYVPMLLYAIALTRNGRAAVLLGDELNITNRSRSMAKYRRQSLALLVPFFVPAVALADKCRPSLDTDKDGYQSS